MKNIIRISGIFQVLVGAGIWGIWVLSFLRGAIPELQSEPFRIAMHLLAEACTGSLLLLSGLGILLTGKKRTILFQVAMGALLYTLIASPGYFAQHGQWGAVGLFMGMLVLAVAFIVYQGRDRTIKIKRTLVLAAGALFGLCSCQTESYIEYDQGLPILHLEGSPYERGAAYGRMLDKEIHETVERWKEEVESICGRDFQEVLDDFFSSTSFRQDMERTDPDLLDEVYGMSESCRIGFQTLLAFQMSEELFAVMDAGAGSNCTSIGKAGTDSTVTVLAQNMDPPEFLHGHPILLHIIPENGDPQYLVFSVPGLFGLAGMNEKGVAVTCMGMSMLNHAQTGLPVVSVIRKILAAPGLEEAEAFIRQTSFAIPQCYGVGGPGGVRCFECSANQVSEFYPFEDSDLILHTNFSINNRDFNRGFKELLAQYQKTVDDPYYCPRYFHAYDEIEKVNRNLDRQRIGNILRLPEPELEPILNAHTLGTLVMELDSDPTLYLALGHQGNEPFQAYSFTDLSMQR